MRNGEFPPVLSVGLGERQNPISKLDYHIVWGSGSTVPASSDGHRDSQSHKRFSRIYTRAARWRRSWNGQFCNEEAKSACYAQVFSSFESFGPAFLRWVGMGSWVTRLFMHSPLLMMSEISRLTLYKTGQEMCRGWDSFYFSPTSTN